MQFRGLLTAAAVLAVLGGGLWYSNRLEKAKEGKPASDAPPKITEIPADQVQQVDVKKGQETTTLKRGLDGKWELTAPNAFRADQDAAQSLAGAFNSMSSDRVVEEKATDLASFGLNAPSVVVTVIKKDGKTTTLMLGDDTPTGSAVFAKKDGDERVYTIPSYVKSSLDKSFKDLQDKRLIVFDSEKMTRMELNVKGQAIEFGKNNNNEWQILKPGTMRADGGEVEELLRRLRDAKADLTVSDDDKKKASSGFGSATLVAIAKVTDPSGTQTLEVRKSKDNTYYARGSAMEGAHKVSSDLGDGVGKTLDQFRNKKLFDFGWKDPGKIEIHDAGKTFVFAKTGDKWDAGGKTMDSTSVQALIDKLRDLKAVTFPATGFGATLLDASVTYDEGKRTEKILISQSGAKFIAKRDGEPSLHEIEKTAVDDLRKAAGDVKEPPPPAKKDDKKK